MTRVICDNHLCKYHPEPQYQNLHPEIYHLCRKDKVIMMVDLDEGCHYCESFEHVDD